MLIELLVFAASVCLCLYYWQRYLHSYWRRHNVAYLQPTTLFGNLRDMFTFKTGFLGQMWALHQDKELSPSAPLVGIYTLYRPALLIRNVDLIKRIMIKDFNSFSNRVLSADPHHDPLGHYNLFFIRNPEWRELRAKLSPTFSSGKVKQMYPLMAEIGQELETVLDALPKDAAIDMKDICGRFTNELIGSTAFGIRAGSLRDANSQFYQHSRAIFAITARRGFEFFCLLFVPVLTRLLRIKLFTKQTSNFLRSSVQHVMAERERTGATRNDFIDTLLALKREAYAQPEQQHPAKNPDFLVAQAALFHTAGYESSSSTLMFALYELALQPRLQERLRAEISVAFGADDSVAYDKLHELPYLDQVVDETLRKYPVVGFMERECTADYSLAPYSDFTVPAGTAIYVSLLGIHRDERYWPEPDKFDPERFAPENRKNLNMNAYMPFGIGPHNCIGMRLGLLQTKLGLLHALRNHRVVAFDETPQQVQFDPYTFVLSNKGGVHLKVERVDN